MKLRIETVVRLYVILLIALLGWCVWASAQEAVTNTVAAAPPTGRPSLASRLSNSEDVYLTFYLNHIPFLNDHAIFGEPLWKYLASLIYIFMAFTISKFLDRAVSVWLKRWAAKTKTTFDDLLLDLLRGPVRIVSFVIFLHIGLNIFRWPSWLADAFSKGLKIIVACSLTYLALKFIDLGLGYWRQNASADGDKTFNEMLFPIISKSLKVFVVIVAVLVTSQNMGINITGVIASLSIGGLALGLAAQDTLANLFGAVSVFLDKPFQIGDRIKLAEVEGVVETVGLRSTRVRSLDGYLITVPNKTMGNATITNITERPTIKTEMNFGLTYDTSTAKVQRALQILEELYRSHPMTHDLLISFNRFGDSALNVQVVHWWKSTDHKAYLAGMQALNLQVKEIFDRERIEFAFPTQTIYVKPDSAPPKAA